VTGRRFCTRKKSECEGERQRRYRLYHASFFEFIASKQEVADERVDLKAMHGQIADTLWNDLFGEK